MANVANLTGNENDFEKYKAIANIEDTQRILSSLNISNSLI